MSSQSDKPLSTSNRPSLPALEVSCAPAAERQPSFMQRICSSICSVKACLSRDACCSRSCWHICIVQAELSPNASSFGVTCGLTGATRKVLSWMLRAGGTHLLHARSRWGHHAFHFAAANRHGGASLLNDLMSLLPTLQLENVLIQVNQQTRVTHVMLSPAHVKGWLLLAVHVLCLCLAVLQFCCLIVTCMCFAN